jgi:hypothetical protein
VPSVPTTTIASPGASYHLILRPLHRVSLVASISGFEATVKSPTTYVVRKGLFDSGADLGYLSAREGVRGGVLKQWHVVSGRGRAVGVGVEEKESRQARLVLAVNNA